MITKKKIQIPIFNTSLTIVIFDKYSEIGHTIDKRFNYDYNPNDGNNGLAINSGSIMYVAISSKSESTVAHESLHIVNYIWEWIGYMPSRDNDEVSAYLLAYIYKKIKEVFDKHKN